VVNKSVFVLTLTVLYYFKAAFTIADPKRTKKTDNLTVCFALSGPAQVKAAHRTLMKLTLGRSR